MTTESEKRHSVQDLANEPVDSPGQADTNVPGEPEQDSSQISDNGSAESALGEIGDLLEPMSTLPEGGENGEPGASDSALNLVEPGESLADSSLRTVMSAQAMFYQGDVEGNEPYDYATELTELQEIPKPSLLTDNVSGDSDGKGNFFSQGGEVLAKSGLGSKQSSSNSRATIKVLGGVGLTVTVASLVLLFSGRLQPTTTIPVQTQIPSILTLPTNLSTAISSATTNPQAGTAAKAWLDAPLNGSLLPFAAVDVTSHFYHPSGVKQIELSINAAVLRTDPSPDTKTDSVYLTQKWIPPAPGTYRLSVRALSTSGDWGDTASTTVTVGEVITVTPTSIAPTTTIVTPPAPVVMPTAVSTVGREITITSSPIPQATRPPTNTPTNTPGLPTRPPTNTAQPPTRPPTDTPLPPGRPPTNTPARR